MSYLSGFMFIVYIRGSLAKLLTVLRGSPYVYHVYSKNTGYRGQRWVLTSSLWSVSLPLALPQLETMVFPVEPLWSQRNGQESAKQSDF